MSFAPPGHRLVRHDDVRREDRHPARQLPHVHIVHRDDARRLQDVATNVGDLDPLRRALDEYGRDLLEQADGPGMIIAAMRRDAMASAGSQPVTRITIAATMTAAEPMRSPMTSR